MKIWFDCGFREEGGKFFPILKLCAEGKEPVERVVGGPKKTAQEATKFAQAEALAMMKQTPGTISVENIQ